MDNNISWYQGLPIETLEKYAVAAGLGVENPLDLQKIREIIGDKKAILEVGCGTGCLGKHLMNEQYVGIESNPVYVNYFAQAVPAEYRQNIILGDFLKFNDQRAFDVVLFPWSIFWDFSASEKTEVLQHSLNFLNPRGVILVDLPESGSAFNTPDAYTPVPTYAADFETLLKPFNISSCKTATYTTATDRTRNIVVITK